MDTCFTTEKAGALLVGGGVPKNFILQSMLMTPNGFDYAVQLTGDRPDLGHSPERRWMKHGHGEKLLKRHRLSRYMAMQQSRFPSLSPLLWSGYKND